MASIFRIKSEVLHTVPPPPPPPPPPPTHPPTHPTLPYCKRQKARQSLGTRLTHEGGREGEETRETQETRLEFMSKLSSIWECFSLATTHRLHLHQGEKNLSVYSIGGFMATLTSRVCTVCTLYWNYSCALTLNMLLR